MAKTVSYITFPGEDDLREVIDATARININQAMSAALSAEDRVNEIAEEVDEQLENVASKLDELQERIDEMGGGGDTSGLQAQITDLRISLGNKTDTTDATAWGKANAAATQANGLVGSKQDKLSAANPLHVTAGGTGASTAEDARSNLGLGTAATHDLGAKVTFSLSGSTLTITTSDGNTIQGV